MSRLELFDNCLLLIINKNAKSFLVFKYDNNHIRILKDNNGCCWFKTDSLRLENKKIVCRVDDRKVTPTYNANWDYGDDPDVRDSFFQWLRGNQIGNNMYDRKIILIESDGFSELIHWSGCFRVMNELVN